MNEFAAHQIIHGQCGCIHRELSEVFGLAFNVDAQTENFNAFADGFDESLHNGTLHTAPVSNLVDNGLAMLIQHLHGRPYARSALGRDIEDVLKISVQCEFFNGNFFRQSEPIELADR
jgi:hypothetical protein